MKNRIQPKTKNELNSIIEENIKLHGNQCDLNHIDVSLVTDMSFLFRGSMFNGDINQWDVSQVKDMKWMFRNSQFNGDISKWNTINVISMNYMFADSEFNRSISEWNVLNVENIEDMFKGNISEKPWWYIENKEERNNCIRKMNLMKNLKDHLLVKDKQAKKVKI